jgi:hypothetical protein
MLKIIAQRLSDNQFDSQRVVHCQMLQQGSSCLSSRRLNSLCRRITIEKRA